MAKRSMGLSDSALASIGVGVGAAVSRLALYYLKEPKAEPWFAAGLVVGALPGQHPFAHGLEWGAGAVGVDSLTKSEILPMLDDEE